MKTQFRFTSTLFAIVLASCLSFSLDASAKRILICIDGTNNDPNDAVAEYDESGLLEDNGISNVLKLHILAGGQLNNTSTDPSQHSFYYVGVGNRGATSIYRSASAAFAITEPKKILKKVYEDLADSYQPGDSIFIFGFSRGAAIARWLAQKINDNGLVKDKDTVEDTVTIEFLGVWDTVAAFKGVNLDRNVQPSASEVKERDGRIAPNVLTAYHLISIDDPRLAFRPVLMGAEDRVHEIWFPGVHGDVGGGYQKDGLSDSTLEFMMQKAKYAGVTFQNTNDIDYTTLTPITREDLQIKPDPLARLHLGSVIDDKQYVAWLQKMKWKDIFAPRQIHVVVDDKVTRTPPLIHYSVFERMKSMPYNYKSDADLIKDVFSLSKKDFKRSLTTLVDSGKIEVKDTGIYLKD